LDIQLELLWVARGLDQAGTGLPHPFGTNAPRILDPMHRPHDRAPSGHVSSQ
jgi:hypothetical protein